MSAVTIRKIDNEADFKILKNDWSELLPVSNSKDITLTWEWLYTWWQVFKDNRELWLLAAYDKDKLIGIAPLLKRMVRYYGFLSFKRIELLGTGEDERDEICSDYLDFIAAKEREADVERAISGYLIQNSNEWDEICLADILDSSAVVKNVLSHLNDKNFTVHEIKKEACPFISLPTSWEELLKSSSYNFRRELNKKKRQLYGEGQVEFTVYSGDSYNAGFDKMVKLHESRWGARGKESNFSSEKFTLFHKMIFSALSHYDGTRLYFLKVNGKEVACRYCLSYGETLYDYLTAYDVNFKSSASPGLQILSYCVEDAIKFGKKSFDFCKGKKGSFKYRWTDKERFVITVGIFNKSGIRNKIFYFINKIVVRLKNILKRTKC